MVNGFSVYNVKKEMIIMNSDKFNKVETYTNFEVWISV